MNRYVAVLLLMNVCAVGFSVVQERGMVRGLVLDAESGEPLPGAHVFIAFTSLGTATSVEGKFEIKGIPFGSAELVVSMIGYEAVTKKLSLHKDHLQVDVKMALSPSVYALDGVTVTGRRDRYHRRNLRIFTQQFIGKSDNAKNTRILNPEVLSFADTVRSEDIHEAELLTATAAEPLEIENRALGYHQWLALITIVLLVLARSAGHGGNGGDGEPIDLEPIDWSPHRIIPQ